MTKGHLQRLGNGFRGRLATRRRMASRGLGYQGSERPLPKIGRIGRPVPFLRGWR
jgi:hypothetical protein